LRIMYSEMATNMDAGEYSRRGLGFFLMIFIINLLLQYYASYGFRFSSTLHIPRMHFQNPDSSRQDTSCTGTRSLEAASTSLLPFFRLPPSLIPITGHFRVSFSFGHEVYLVLLARVARSSSLELLTFYCHGLCSNRIYRLTRAFYDARSLPFR
jgi:hypothetical protein